MPTTFDLPKRIMAEFPNVISDKIAGGEQLSESDKSMIRQYLDSIILHPENMVSGREQLLSLLSFYFYVGARLNHHTVTTVKNWYGGDELNEWLDSYGNVSSEVRIELRKNPMASSGFVNFCAMYADKGCRTHNFYAENFGKLLSSLERWVTMDAPYLMSNCEYVIYIDSLAVAKIEKGKALVPVMNDLVLGFITNTFGAPHDVDVHCYVKREEQGAFQIKGIVIEGGIADSSNVKRETAVLPNSPSLKVRLLKEKLVNLAQQSIKEYAFAESINADIQTKVYVNEQFVGVMGIAKGQSELLAGIQVFSEQYFSCQNTDLDVCDEDSVTPMTWLDRLLSYFK